MADVVITEYTDPGCPWAYSAEPFRRRLAWLYGDALEWRLRLVGLSTSPEDYARRGMTPEKQASSFRRIAADHGMPIDTRVRPRMAATVPACRAVVATRLHAPEREGAVLRALRLRHFSGDLLDEPATLAGAARDAGLDPAALEGWMAEAATEAALREDMEAARRPAPAARVLDYKLANWSGGRRYTCPSYEIQRATDDVRLAVPGFQPFPVYDVITANFVPGLERRENPESVTEVLEWAGEPLATQEVAVVSGLPVLEAREELGRVARMTPLGTDGLWSPG